MLRAGERLVVADLPGGAEGRGDLLALSEGRTPGELLIVVQRVPGCARRRTAVGGGGRAGRRGRQGAELAERQRAGVDRRRRPRAHDPRASRPEALPAEVRGKPIETDGPLRSASLRALMARLRVIGGRRLKALGFLLSAWALLLLVTAPWPRGRAWAMRAGALGVLWAPVAVLIPAALEPSAPVEYATIALACLGLGALSGHAACRGLAPCSPPRSSAVVALTADALAGTQLLMRSLLGPDPILGARFYGIGNELKSGLAVLVLAAVAAALYRAARSPRAALAMASAGVRPRGGGGLGEDRRRRGRRDTRELCLRRGDRHAGARRAHAQARADGADQPGCRAGRRWPRSTSPPRTARATSPAASCTPVRRATCATSSSGATRPPGTS